MLMPIIAAVGSFVVSERILKPKVTALVVLSCLAAYDVLVAPPAPLAATDHAHHPMDELDEFWDFDAPTDEADDVAISMRVYRGPAMVAVALFCAASVLRLWRRNGVACDELLFLPGTPHEGRCAGQAGSARRAAPARAGAAVGDGDGTGGDGGDASRGAEARVPGDICVAGFEGDAAAGAARATVRSQRHETLEMESSEASAGAGADDVEERPLMEDTAPAPNLPVHDPPPPQLHRRGSPMTFIRDQAMKGLDMLVIRKPSRPPHATDNDVASGKSPSHAPAPDDDDAKYDAEYAPSAPSVLGAGLDLCIPVLFNFHMFVVLMKGHYKKEAEGAEHGGSSGDDAGEAKVDVKYSTAWMTPPQIPPLVLPLFSIAPLVIRSIVPRRQRRRFFTTMLQGTVLSPFRPVRFRDAFVADCLTSTVRTLVDLVYALAYFATAVFGLCSGKYDLNQAGVRLSKSMLWHGLILPALSVLPLFIKFLQTLRQAYDTGQRWPHLGNAFKYFSAGLVILYGMTHATLERSPWWLLSFIAATVYQIVWDTVVDWELLVFVPDEPFRKPTGSAGAMANAYRAGRDALPRCGRLRLRPRRLFDDSYYWKALVANAVLRFCWMAGFIPAYRVSIADHTTQVTFVDVAHGWSFVLLAMLEIFRRSIWAIIKVELETIRLKDRAADDLADAGEKVDMASTAEEYAREGSVATNTWRSRWSRLKKTALPTAATTTVKKTARPTTSATEEDAQEVRANPTDPTRQQYSQLEETEPMGPPGNTPEKPTRRRLCVSTRRGFLRWLYMVELLLWIVAFLVASYYVILKL